MTESAANTDTVVPVVEARTRLTDFRRAFVSNNLAVAGAVVLSVFILIRIFAPLIAPYDPISDQNLTEKFASPSLAFVNGQHAIVFPGIAIALSVLSVNFIGDGLRDALDPRRR